MIREIVTNDLPSYRINLIENADPVQLKKKLPLDEHTSVCEGGGWASPDSRFLNTFLAKSEIISEK